MRNCEVCGTFNFRENNYCTHCGCKIAIENICPFCGKKNSNGARICSNCHNQITPVTIDTFDDLFTDYNLLQVINNKLSPHDFLRIFKRIFKKLDYVKITGRTPKEKVLKIANVFTTVIPKSSGVAYGEYGVMYIWYDDRVDDALQISTIIHELAHYILFDFAVNTLSEVLDVNPSPVLESFIEYVLTDREMEVMNEYCAHTVENRFIPLEFQRFNSFNACVNDLNLSYEDSVPFVEMGLSFARYIIYFLEKYIDETFRESIKLQFKRDMLEPKNDKIHYYSEETLSIPELMNMFMGIVYMYFDICSSDDIRQKLEFMKLKFEERYSFDY